MRESLAASDELDTPLHLLARRLGVHWSESSIRIDTPGTYLKLGSPRQVLALRGFGSKKLHHLLSLLLSLGRSAAVAPKSDATINPSPIRVPDGEHSRYVDQYWTQLTRELRQAPFLSAEIEALALRWGLKWQSKASGLVLKDVVESPSWRRFQTTTPGVGKKKIALLGAIVWRAWSEVSPDGPAGPPPKHSEEARSIVSRLASDLSPEGKILAAFVAAELKPEHQSILVRRYGLRGQPAMTLEEIGEVEQVTRERIRQVQSAALERLTSHCLAAEILKQGYELHRAELFEELAAKLGTRRITVETPIHRFMRAELLFFAEARHKTLEEWRSSEVRQGRLQPIPGGWWIGNLYIDNITQKADSCAQALKGFEMPVSLDRLSAASNLQIDTLRAVVDALGHQTIGGYVFDRRSSVAEVRAIHVLKVAHSEKRFLWAEDELLAAARRNGAWTSSSRRGLVMDLQSLPGACIDLPGRYIIINPQATRVFELAEADSSDLPTRTHASLTWSAAQSEEATLAAKVASIFETGRILTFAQIEERYCSERFGLLASLYPTLVGLAEVTRYAPGYWGPTGLTLTPADIEVLCNEEDLERYIRARRSGGIIEDFQFWSPEMEYAWCRWAENNAPPPLFSSLLSISQPETWPTLDAIKRQWLGKQRLHALYQLSVPRMSLEKGYCRFKPVYALVHFATVKRKVGTATIPHLLGLREVDRRAVGTMALLGALEVLVIGPDLDEPWSVGRMASEWLSRMSKLLIDNPTRIEEAWQQALSQELLAMDRQKDFGLFTAEDLCHAVEDWTQQSKS